MTFLNLMTPGQSGRVVGFTDDSRIVRRLYELGIQPGRSIVHLRSAPLRDPIEVQVGPNCLALRRAEASMVTVEVDT